MDHEQGIADDLADHDSGLVTDDRVGMSVPDARTDGRDAPRPAPCRPSASPLLPGDLPAMRSGGSNASIAVGKMDRSSVLAAVLGGMLYLGLACLSLLLAQASDSVSPVWLSNAAAVALLLRARISNEVPFLLAAFAGSLAANVVADQPAHLSLVFSLANLVEIIAVLALTRSASRRQPDMNTLTDLARFIWAGGLMGPLLSALVVAPVMSGTAGGIQAGLIKWFLTDSMAMILIVPTALLLVDRMRGQLPAGPAHPAEAFALLAGGMICTFLIFRQTHYPLVFLIQPITLLHAFRLGSLGSALHGGGVAVVAGGMSFAGFGPIHAASGSTITGLHLLQVFIAANFLTGLPVAAILAGRDRMLAALEAGKRQLDLLAENITDAILRYDLQGVCTYASPSVREVMGAAPETYIGKPLAARLHPESRDRTLQALHRLLDGTSEKERLTYRRFADQADGTPVFLEADCAVVHNPETGEREGVVVAARDVTERVELEQLLTRARRHAENAAQAKSDFLANMSHEIRTPMNGVLGFAELMLQGELAADQRRFAELIVQSGRSMMMLLNDVLDLSKIESGQFTIDRAPVDIHASLSECAALHRLGAEEKGIALTFSHDGDGDDPPQPWVLTDGLRLRQIALNLIGNAVKFTEAGRIDVSYALSPRELRVTVADTGIGISETRLETIFQPFTQADAETARRFGGTGLGLSISRQLAALMGGRIEVDSAPGEGSRFTLVLPAALAQPVAALAPPEPVAAADMPANSRILLVEDHDINRLLMCEMLERCGQKVEVAHDGNEGIAMVIDSIMRGRPYDLVLMDVQMPDCDGYAATRAIRGEGIGPGLLPIIALTANAFPEDIAAARAAGMQGHLAKPVVLAQLARALQRWLPTRIIEAAENNAPRAAERASTLARSPQLVARWQMRRAEAVAAVRRALDDDGALGGDESKPVPDGAAQAEAEELIRLAHKLAGTAAMFGEPALGTAAAALERALRHAGSAADSRSLARQLLALAERDAAQASDHRSANS
ncbi:hybrid sensor histidine kinase/response regulator [Porphyrobacter sp. AAP60]|uniref:hybrid sensor histidine kinase/response regulator n=1 Tax=Porphyrobacter sp. AAP60 TaxID=1523423 RepID=UPI0006B981F7|nr:ATP-binding protein [Porphyrobacter sp. AAP60]